MEHQENENNSLQFTNDFSIQKERKVKLGENISNDNSLLLSQKANKSVCEVIRKDGYGSGFFCKVIFENNEIICLFTNNHVITEEMLSKKDENIEIKISNQIYKIALNLNRRIWTDSELDFTCIEIMEKDNLLSIIDPFEIDKNSYNIEFELENYDRKGIVITSIGQNKNIELGYGAILYVKNTEDRFLHDCNTVEGYSGGPIILMSNLRLIGIHCGYEKENKKNLGIYFKKILEYIEKKTIKISIEIESNEKKEDFLIFNQNEDNKEEIKDNVKVYLNNKKVKLINNGDQWKINYDFEKDGIYELKIVFTRNISNTSGLFEKCNIISIDLSNFDTSKVNNMGYMFNGCNKLKEIKGLNKINTSNVIDMGVMFQNCSNLEYLDLTYFDTSKVNNMEYLFFSCNKLKKIKGLNKLNTSNVNNMNSMFQNCSNLEYLDLSNFDTSKVNDMGFMFSVCNNLKEIEGINKFNTSNVINMNGIFQQCTNLEDLDVSNFDTSKVNDMGYMFSRCEKLKEIKGINKLNTSNVTIMRSMFQKCSNIEYLDLSNFDTSKVNDISFMFNCCDKLKKIKGLNKLNTSNVNNMNSMFQNCSNLEYLDLSNFDTSKVKDMGLMFSYCNKLKEIEGINKFNTSNVLNMKAMFQHCNNFENLDLSSFDTSKVSDMNFMFNDCNKVREIKGISQFKTNELVNTYSMFQDCSNIIHIINSKLNSIIFKSMFKFNIYDIM